MTPEDKERLIKAMKESKEIRKIYDDTIIKSIPFDTWVKNMIDRVLGQTIEVLKPGPRSEHNPL